MEIIKTATVRIDLGATLSSMEVGESWEVPPTLATSSLRVYCCNFGKAVNKSFTVSTKDTENTIITRTR